MSANMRYDLRDMAPQIYAIEKIEEAMQLCEQECKCLSDELAKPLMSAIDALRLPRRDRIVWHGPSRNEVIIALYNNDRTQIEISHMTGFSQSGVHRIVSAQYGEQVAKGTRKPTIDEIEGIILRDNKRLNTSMKTLIEIRAAYDKLLGRKEAFKGLFNTSSRVLSARSLEAGKG